MQYLLLVFYALTMTAHAAVLHVPVDYRGIQVAIDAAAPGDLVLVMPGTYKENLDFLGKPITVQSRGGPESTVIDGGGQGSVVVFDQGEPPDAQLIGFTITNGLSTYGGGILCSGSRPTIKGNIITKNMTEGVTSRGAGICCLHAIPLIVNNTIVDNVNNGGLGGGIACSGSAGPVIVGNLVADNSSCGIVSEFNVSIFIMKNIVRDNYATGIYVYNSTLGEISNNLSVGNDYGMAFGQGSLLALNNTVTQNGVGLYIDAIVSVHFVNNILWNNWGEEVHLAQGGPPPISYSVVDGGWPGTGNIDKDPLFVDPDARDFHIRHDSPCRDAANPQLKNKPETDFEGDPRLVYGVSDIGADEFHTHLYCTGLASPGGAIEIKLTDTPGKTPAWLWCGSSVLTPHVPTRYGGWFLKPPILFEVPCGTVPSPGGVITVPLTLPSSMPAWDMPLQAVIEDRLTNLCVIPVR